MSSGSISGVPANAILVVDLNHGGFGTLTEVLKGIGYTVRSVDPLAASGSIRDFPPTAILVKLSDYDLSAISTCSAFTSANPGLPLVVVGPKIEGREKARMLEAGAADYVEFPFDTDELLARIRSLVRTYRRQLEYILNGEGPI